MGSKQNIECCIGKYIQTPGETLCKKGKQQKFQAMCDVQEMSPTSLVRHDMPVRRSSRIQNQPMNLAKKQKLAKKKC